MRSPIAPTELHFLFSGEFGTPGLTFVEIETSGGQSVRVGDWFRRPDGLWALRVHVLLPAPPEPNVLMEARVQGWFGRLVRRLAWSPRAPRAVRALCWRLLTGRWQESVDLIEIDVPPHIAAKIDPDSIGP